MVPSPRMRGSTLARLNRRRRRYAFPAHAGIDRRRPSATCRTGCLPRACGDRPRESGSALIMRRPSPRMRGSTENAERRCGYAGAFPAHAGIDPKRRTKWIRLSRLPRACGDRPPLDMPLGNTRRPSPRMRGSTLPVHQFNSLALAFPAHAGIDLAMGLLPASDQRLPRACGDRPSTSRSRSVAIQPSPRMRGSTRGHVFDGEPRDAFPAHAGIDPSHRVRSPAPTCLPRACGDRPDVLCSVSATDAPSPRMRGSTPSTAPLCDSFLAFPAHAGIDLIRGGQEAAIKRLPRACGDRPSLAVTLPARSWPSPRMRGSTRDGHTRCGAFVAFPAHAGIDPALLYSEAGRSGLPRACGDRPVPGCAMEATMLPSPRMRGSTRSECSFQWSSTAFPAHAGIDLACTSSRNNASCLPRACGDRPFGCSLAIVLSTPSPRMRGSTWRVIHKAPSVYAFPAHAGIDPRSHCVGTR